MITLPPVAIDLLKRAFAKLAQRSSVASYIAFILGSFGVHNPSIAAHAAAIVAWLAGIFLFLLSDAEVMRVITGQSPASPVVVRTPISVPAAIAVPSATVTVTATKTAFVAAITKEPDMSLLTSITSFLSKLSPEVQAAVNGITLVEAIAPNLPGAAKLQSVQANVVKAVGTVANLTALIEGTLAQLKQLGVVSSSTPPATAQAVPAETEAPVATV